MSKAVPVQKWKHGTSNGYSNYGCHCDLCKKAWAEDNKRWRKINRRGRYGVRISHDEVRALLRSQGGKCAICHDPLTYPDEATAIDHCHKTRVIRGVLCRRCNIGLGLFRDSSEILRNATRYLRKFELRLVTVAAILYTLSSLRSI